MRQRPLAYHWLAERYPDRRTRILVYWAGVLQTTRHHWRAYQAEPWPVSWLHAALCVHRYESTDWHANTGNGYYGGMQFDLATWASAGGTGRPDLASPSTQLRVAYVTWQHRRWAPWPTTSRMCGL